MLAKATDQAIKHNNKMDQTDCADTQTDTTNEIEAMYVIDLFSGGQSWRPSVERIGMIYEPINIKNSNGEVLRCIQVINPGRDQSLILSLTFVALDT